MSRHTSPNRSRIDDAYPVRIKIRVPPNGLGNLLDDMAQWLQANLEPESHKNQSTRGVYCNATAFYFRRIEDAQAFLVAFPTLELADGVNRH